MTTEAQVEAAAKAMQRFDAELASNECPWAELDPRDQVYWRKRARAALAAAEKAGRPQTLKFEAPQ
jgi:hypothetical protein